MNKKRIIALLLAAAIPTLLMTACGGDTTTTGDSSDTSVVSVTESASAGEAEVSAESEAEANTIDVDSLTDEQLAEYYDKVFTAVQKLDIETLKLYTKEGDEAVLTLEQIAASPEYKDLWDKTVGKMVYMPKSSIVLAKSPAWLFGKWYTMHAEENAEIPESTCDLTLEEVNEFYDKYYEECPYVAEKLLEDDLYAFNEEDTGKLCFGIREILTPFGLEEIADTYLLTNYDVEKYGVYLFGEQDCLNLGYDYIAEEDKLPCYKELMEFDLDKLVEIIDNNAPDDGGIYQSYCDLYLKDEEHRATIKAWMEENCTAFRTLNNVEYFYTPDFENETIFEYADPEEKEIMKGMNIASHGSIYWFPSDWNGFTTMFDIIDSLVKQGVLPDLYEFDF